MPHIHTKHGQFDLTVEVFIVNNNKVLLRLHDKYIIWLGVGGHVELDEDPNQTAIREAEEEVGLNITLIKPHEIAPSSNIEQELIPPFYLTKHQINQDHGHITLIYIAISSTRKVIPEKITDKWQWLSKAEIESNKLNLMPNIKYYALKALEIGLNYT